MAFPLVFVSAPRWRGAKYLQNSGFFRPTVFFSAAHARGVVSAKKKKGTLWLKKLPKISNQWSPAASDTVKGLCKNKGLCLWHKRIVFYVLVSSCSEMAGKLSAVYLPLVCVNALPGFSLFFGCCQLHPRLGIVVGSDGFTNPSLSSVGRTRPLQGRLSSLKVSLTFI